MAVVTPNPVCGAYYPTVLNGQIVSGTESSESVEYECLSGFFMTGNKRITCDTTTGLWDEAPTCSVIDDNIDVDVYRELK